MTKYRELLEEIEDAANNEQLLNHLKNVVTNSIRRDTSAIESEKLATKWYISSFQANELRVKINDALTKLTEPKSFADKLMDEINKITTNYRANQMEREIAETLKNADQAKQEFDPSKAVTAKEAINQLNNNPAELDAYTYYLRYIQDATNHIELNRIQGFMNRNDTLSDETKCILNDFISKRIKQFMLSESQEYFNKQPLHFVIEPNTDPTISININGHLFEVTPNLGYHVSFSPTPDGKILIEFEKAVTENPDFNLG